MTYPTKPGMKLEDMGPLDIQVENLIQLVASYPPMDILRGTIYRFAEATRQKALEEAAYWCGRNSYCLECKYCEGCRDCAQLIRSLDTPDEDEGMDALNALEERP